MQKNVKEQLKDYFSNTPQEQLDKDWEELKHWNEIGPDVFEWAKNIKSLDGDISEWVDKNFWDLV